MRFALTPTLTSVSNQVILTICKAMARNPVAPVSAMRSKAISNFTPSKSDNDVTTHSKMAKFPYMSILSLRVFQFLCQLSALGHRIDSAIAHQTVPSHMAQTAPLEAQVPR